MNENKECDTPTHLIWVNNVDGQPKVRWGRIVGFVGLVFVANALVHLAMSFIVGLPFRWPLLFLVSSGAIFWLVLAVELQRQRILMGQWRLRLGIGTGLILMALAASFFAVIGNEIRKNQRGHAANLTMKAKLEKLIDGGNAYISTPDGTGVSCDISRSSFSDDDLQQLIQLASERTPGVSQITLLNLENTSVSEAGIQAVRLCPHLTHLFLPRYSLSDETIAAIATCRKLSFMTLDESKITEEQMAKLGKSLPNLRVNGKRWSERKK